MQTGIMDIEYVGIKYWEYDFEGNSAVISEYAQKLYGLEETITDFPETIIGMGIIHEKEIESFLQAHTAIKSGIRYLVREIRFKDAIMKRTRWVRMYYIVRFGEKGKPIGATAIVENIDSVKQIEEQLFLAAEQTGTAVWTYDIETQMFKNAINCETLLGNAVSVYRFPESTIENGAIHPDDVAEYIDFYEKVKHGSKDLSLEVRRRSPVTNKLRWIRINYTCVYDNMGRPYKAIGTAVDITAQKLEKEHLEQAWENCGKAQQGLKAVLFYNATKDVVINYKRFAKVVGGANPGDRMSDILQETVQYVKGEEKKKEWLDIHDCKRQIERYRNGIYFADVEYFRYEPDGRIFWSKNEVNIIQEQGTGDIQVFAYMYDIDASKWQSQIAQRMFELEYDMVGIISLETERFVHVLKKDEISDITSNNDKYYDVLERASCRFAEKADKLEGIESMRLDVICKNLETTEIYEKIFMLKLHSGQKLKKWRFSYLNADKNFLLVEREDA